MTVREKIRERLKQNAILFKKMENNVGDFTSGFYITLKEETEFLRTILQDLDEIVKQQAKL